MVVAPQIIVGVDGSPSSRAALEWAALRARRLKHSLQLVHSVPDYLVSPGRIEYQSVRDVFEGLLHSEASRAREFAPAVDVHTSLHFGEPAQVLAEVSSGSAMAVVGTDRTADAHGEGFGAVNLQLATIGQCPVAVIPTRQSAVNAGVVVGIDGSPQSTAAAYFAASEATSTEQELTVIYASSAVAGWLRNSALGPTIVMQGETAGRMILESTVAALRARHIHLTVCERYEHDDVPARALINAGQTAAMLVVGNRGRGAVQRALMGSTTQDLLLHVPCPIVLTRPDNANNPEVQDSDDGVAPPAHLPTLPKSF